MYKNVLESIQGIEIYPLIAFGFFFLFFVVLLIWVFRMKKSDFDEISRLPLEEDAPENIFNLDSKS